MSKVAFVCNGSENSNLYPTFVPLQLPVTMS